MKQKCEVCGDFKSCNEDGMCFDCLQDESDLEDWNLENGFDEDDNEDDED